MTTQNPNTKISLAQLEALIDKAKVEEHIFHEKVLVVSFQLESGFTIQGIGSCVDPQNFDLEIGRSVARKNAIDQLWQLEGYLLQLRLREAGIV